MWCHTAVCVQGDGVSDSSSTCVLRLKWMWCHTAVCVQGDGVSDSSSTCVLRLKWMWCHTAVCVQGDGVSDSCSTCVLRSKWMWCHSDNNNNRIQRRYSRFFYNLLTAPRTVSNMHAQLIQAQSCTNHVQHIERLSRATCRVTCHLVRRDSSAMKFDRVEMAFIWALFCWLNH